MKKGLMIWMLGLVGCIGQLLGQSPWVSAVVDYRFGTSQTFGQSSEYFPANVIGPVSVVSSLNAPSSSPTDIVSIGKGGYITVTFESPILDGPGADFIVFENPFLYAGGQVFDEWLRVEASADGDTWYAFPYDTITGEGFAGRTPTAPAPADYRNPATSGGDAFDIALLGLDTVRYIRLWDATEYQTPDRLAAELDAVVAIHQVAFGVHRSAALSDRGFAGYRPSGKAARLSWQQEAPQPDRVFVYDLSGRLLTDARYPNQGDILLPNTSQLLLVSFHYRGLQYSYLVKAGM
jgi:hypothetical protein